MTVLLVLVASLAFNIHLASAEEKNYGNLILNEAIELCEEEIPIAYEKDFGEKFAEKTGEKRNYLSIVDSAPVLQKYAACVAKGMGIIEDDGSNLNATRFKDFWAIIPTNSVDDLIDNCYKSKTGDETWKRYNSVVQCVLPKVNSEMFLPETKDFKEFDEEVEEEVDDDSDDSDDDDE